MSAGGPRVAAALALPALLALAACDGTVDNLGWNGPPNVRLRTLARRPPPPNAFKTLRKTDAEIATKIADMFNQLFYGDATQAIYFPTGADQASIQDILHSREVRTEGMGLGMMICVQLDKRAEFDRLWAHANEILRQKEPPRSGYFRSFCDTLTATTESCDDPYGASQMLMALIFAHDRWGSTGTLNYEAGAVALLDVMRHKQDVNGGTVDGITDMFDPKEALPYHLPTVAFAGVSRPSIVMPAYYDLWREAVDDPFWSRAARAGREYWKRSADPDTGLMPVRANFDGTVYPNWENFDSESYRAHFNMALDQIWGEGDPWEVAEADKLLRFFAGLGGSNNYGTAYKLDGTLVDPLPDVALVAANGVTALIADELGRDPFIEEVWGLSTPVGQGRYYSGILGLTALLILSGQYRVW
jgi:oligosaccharide reducing-end xylanase